MRCACIYFCFRLVTCACPWSLGDMSAMRVALSSFPAHRCGIPSSSVCHHRYYWHAWIKDPHVSPFHACAPAGWLSMEFPSRHTSKHSRDLTIFRRLVSKQPMPRAAPGACAMHHQSPLVPACNFMHIVVPLLHLMRMAVVAENSHALAPP
jgi:hypothetical protein